jgi:hypothetical protein
MERFETGVAIVPFIGSFKLGPFSVNPEGGLTITHPDISPGFTIRWRGRSVHARLLQSDIRDGHLFLQSSLGRIPSTASDPGVRSECLAMMRSLLSELPRDWNVRLLPDHQPQLEVATTVTLPITVTSLVSELTLFLLQLSPYLDLMDQTGVGLVIPSEA